jgi:hypothetical protein
MHEWDSAATLSRFRKSAAPNPTTHVLQQMQRECTFHPNLTSPRKKLTRFLQQ